MKFYLFVLGCQMNVSDSERLRALLKGLGFKETKNEKQADIIIAIACSVRQKPIDRLWGKLKIWKLMSNNSCLILTGCITDQDKKEFKKKFDLVFDIQNPNELISFLQKEELINSNFLSYSSSPSMKLGINSIGKSFFALDPERKDNKRAYIAIGNGCDNFCTYCVVPYTRGREIYRPKKEIIAEVKQALKNGAQIITLIAQNVNSYKSKVQNQKSKNDAPRHPEEGDEKEGDERISNISVVSSSVIPAPQQVRGKTPAGIHSFDFVKLLEEIDAISGDFKIEFLTSHPKDMSDYLIKSVAKLDKVNKWIHLPVQAGSDEILAKMNRKYTREHYLNLVKKIRKIIPNVVLTTDIIVGFPTESKEQFAQTVDLAKKCQFDQAFIAMYSPRPGTVATKMKDDVLSGEKKRRFRILDQLINHKKANKQNPWTVANKSDNEY